MILEGNLQRSRLLLRTKCYGGREGSPAAALEKPRGKHKGRAVNAKPARQM